MSRRECSTQAEADAAAAAGDVIVWRGGHLLLRGSSRAELYDSSRAELYDSSRAELYDSSRAELRGSSRAILYDSSRGDLYDSSRAYLYDNSSATDGVTGAPLRRDRPRLILGPLGPRRDTISVSLPSDGSEPIVYDGRRSGRLSEFVARVDGVYPTGHCSDEYRAAIAMIRTVAAIPQEAT